jgi:hypothetical protein
MYSSVCVAQSAGEQETFVLLSLWERGVRVLNLYLCFRVQTINFILSLGNVNCSVAVMLRGISIQQRHPPNWTYVVSHACILDINKCFYIQKPFTIRRTKLPFFI